MTIKASLSRSASPGEMVAENVAKDQVVSPIPRLSRFLLWGLASVALAAAVWQIAVITGILPAEYFPGIPELVSSWFGLLADQVFWSALGSTFYSTVIGLMLGIVVAVPLGVIIGRNVYLYHAARFVLEFARPIPAVALIPVVVLFFGAGADSKLLLVFLAVVFPLIVQTTYGVRDIDPVALDTAEILGFSKLRRLFYVLLPAAGPYIMTGVRVTASMALLVSVSTEIIIGAPGLGQAITVAENSYALNQMYALIAMTGFVGVVVNLVVSAIEKRTTMWARNVEGDQ